MIDISYKLSETVTVSFEDGGELSMGGPCVGRARINGQIIDGEYIYTPPILSTDEKYLLIGRHSRNQDKSDRRYGYRIVIIDLSTRETYQSNSIFVAVYLVRMNGKEIDFFAANHDQMEQFRRTILFTEDNFSSNGLLRYE